MLSAQSNFQRFSKHNIFISFLNISIYMLLLITIKSIKCDHESKIKVFVVCLKNSQEKEQDNKQ